MSKKHQHPIRSAGKRTSVVGAKGRKWTPCSSANTPRLRKGRRKPEMPAIAAKAPNPKMPTRTRSYVPSAPITRQPTDISLGQAFADTLCKLKVNEQAFAWGNITLKLVHETHRVVGTFTNSLGEVLGTFQQLLKDIKQLLSYVQQVSRVKVKDKVVTLYKGPLSLGSIQLQTA